MFRWFLQSAALLLQLIDIPLDPIRRIAVRFRAADLISDNPIPADIERRWDVVETHQFLCLFHPQARNREGEFHIVQITLKSLGILIDTHQEKCDVRVILVIQEGCL